MSAYGLPAGSNIPYGDPGFPQWVYDLCNAVGLEASTYPGHQESERAEAGFAPNPDHDNRGIDFAGPVDKMQAFAEYLLSIRSHLEQVIWQNPDGRRVGVAGGDDVTDTQYYSQDYPDHTQHVHCRVSAPIPLPSEAPVSAPRPDFNEYPLWSGNSQDRLGTKIDLFLLHTQEGAGNADSLARWLDGHGVSYHYTISQDPVDHGVTVCDVVDTDRASWSCLDANNRSINLCYAGSSVSWTRDQWLANSRAIDVSAYLAVQDCRKYGIPLTVIAPPYTAGRAGISDHDYVTTVLGVGTHTDVGLNFPWDYFAQRVAYWSNPTPAPAPAPVPTPAPAPTTDRQLLEAINAKLDQLLAR